MTTPQSSSIAAKYVINEGNITDEITCHGKETMSLAEIEKALQSHFNKKAADRVNNLQSVIKTTQSLAEEKINEINPTIMSNKKTSAQHLQDARQSAEAAASSIGNAARDIFEQATSATKKAVDDMQDAAEKSIQQVSESVSQTVDDVASQAKQLETRVKGNRDIVNPTVGNQTPNMATPSPIRKTISNTLPTAVSIASSPSVRQMTMGGGRKRKNKKNNKRTKKRGKKKMRKTYKKHNKKHNKKHTKKSHKKRVHKKKGRKTKKR